MITTLLRSKKILIRIHKPEYVEYGRPNII